MQVLCTCWRAYDMHSNTKMKNCSKTISLVKFLSSRSICSNISCSHSLAFLRAQVSWWVLMCRILLVFSRLTQNGHIFGFLPFFWFLHPVVFCHSSKYPFPLHTMAFSIHVIKRQAVVFDLNLWAYRERLVFISFVIFGGKSISTFYARKFIKLFQFWNKRFKEMLIFICRKTFIATWN